MSVVFVLVPVALALAGVAVGAYVWAARRGQFDDLETPALRMLHDDESEERPRGNRGLTKTSASTATGNAEDGSNR